MQYRDVQNVVLVFAAIGALAVLFLIIKIIWMICSGSLKLEATLTDKRQDKKIKEQEDFYTFRGFSSINERQAQIIKILKDKPTSFFTAKELTIRFNISPKTARTDLQHLVALGLMKESPVNKRKIGYLRSDEFDAALSELTNN